MLAVALVLVVVALVVVLALAPRLRLFDDRRVRVGFLVLLAVVALAVPLGAVAVVDRTADAREAAAAEELYDWLSARTFADAFAAVGPDPAAAPGVTVARIEDGVLVVERPVVVAWQSRCVIGRLPPEGLPSVKRTSAPCP